ncbi:unnamed protein product [Rhizoctonia solani]|uniref:Uncharacterized protein n=1 Tax=Rhizoctonia solani TaxID=456999 RepID=A0A8H2XZ53_9AGAM|nr:unnamed protein product [Rhizoctonia solani]
MRRDSSPDTSTLTCARIMHGSTLLGAHTWKLRNQDVDTRGISDAKVGRSRTRAVDPTLTPLTNDAATVSRLLDVGPALETTRGSRERGRVRWRTRETYERYDGPQVSTSSAS